MLPTLLLSAAALFFQISGASVTVLPPGGDSVCAGQIVESENYIGQDNKVKVQHVTCPGTTIESRVLGRQAIVDTCGNTCNTNCFTPSGGGPNPPDCTVIADALLFDSQNVAADFVLGTGVNNTIVMQYQSCLSFFVNQLTTDLEYCRVDWASLISFIAPNCQSTQNAHGGNCVASDQAWFAQVQHS
ncbi:hypothetical protein FB45DRAFT_838622 [Roridomyces roridus]|uniref:Uncharacterized protein n=1 Tax=Roridomyces roridus TaxID=1738132 RepID=A0AAD7FFE6_9AGAR|nr:hypothetical protein FB45DRAFT_838622 [Roridomyces roridus]